MQDKVYLKEYCLIKQGFYKLENKEKDSAYLVAETAPNSLVVGSLIVPLSLLTNLFFNLSFSLLPDLISFNTP